MGLKSLVVRVRLPPSLLMSSLFEFNPAEWPDDVKQEFNELMAAAPAAIDWLIEHTKDRRWDCVVEAYKILTKQHGPD